jgi:hypothetical protein
MGLLIKPEDFTGKFRVAINTQTEALLQKYIDKYEKLYLIRLLGVELYKLFEADVTAYLPQTPPYTTIYAPIIEDDGNCVRISEGMKEMILGFVYFEYLRDLKFKNTVSGGTVNNVEAANEADPEVTVYQRYNEAVRNVETIQWYIGEHESDFPDYNGQEFKLAYWV